VAKEFNQTEYGDYQTPKELSLKVCNVLKNLYYPQSILEPNCGKGSFLISSAEIFENLKILKGFDVNAEYVKDCKNSLEKYKISYDIQEKNFFNIDWGEVIENLPKPLLVLGNPPWVTSSGIGVLGGDNLPQKSNFQGHKGFDALTGKSNFDISEWMLIHLLKNMQNQEILAMLCKTSVARKSLKHAWKNNFAIENAKIYNIDAKQYFNVSTDACLLVCEFSINKNKHRKNAKIYNDLENLEEIGEIYFDGKNIVNLRKTNYELEGEIIIPWRSGIKHDCSKVMELTKQENNILLNGLKEKTNIEQKYLFPLLKSSDVAKGNIDEVRKLVIVTQEYVGQDTEIIQEQAPLTWEYLENHSQYLDARKSVIYKNKPKFSIFGIGDYSFAKYKLVISGLYKSLEFKIIRPIHNKPVMLDDTCYFLPCDSKEQCEFLYKILNTNIAKQHFEKYIFWDSKRPITADVLHKMDLIKLSKILGFEKEAYFFFRTHINLKDNDISAYKTNKKKDIIKTPSNIQLLIY